MVIGRYDPIVAEASRRYGVPEATIRAVMGVESGGRADAVSPKGAAGLMQIMAATYQDVAKRHGLGPDRFDPRNNIFAGTAYLGEMHNQFGNWDEALMAYNMGPGRMTRVRAGTATVPGETRDYLPKVRAALGQGPAGGTTAPAPLLAVDVGRNMYAGPPAAGHAGQERGNMAVRSVGGGLLQEDETNNWLNGLGGLLGEGQTASQPPGPSISPFQYMLGGASQAVGQLAGVRDRRVGIGELLGALGGGMTAGAAAGQQAARVEREDARAEQESRLNNVYKAAMTRRALMPEGTEPKVVNGGIYENGQWKRAPWATVDQGGPLEGTGIDAQMTNVYVALEQKRANGQPLTQQEELLYGAAVRHLNKPRVVAGPDGVVREVAPAPLPTLPNAGGAAPPAVAAPPPAAAPPPGPDLLDTQRPPAAAPPPAPTATVTPSGSRVTVVVPPTVKPTNEQTLAQGFANRLYAANTELDTLGDRGADVPSLYDRTVGQVPVLGNYAVSNDYQQMTQAQREFINAQLRRESGAAVSESEWENARQQYFPQPGDSEPVLAQKRRSRNMAIANMAQAAGPAGVNFTPPKVTMPDEKPAADRAAADPETARLRSKYGLE